MSREDVTDVNKHMGLGADFSVLQRDFCMAYLIKNKIPKK